ncbi:MAG: protein kinase [bacterium]
MIGKTISHYKILEKLGEGGMGVVYKAEDTKLDRLVALKFLPLHLSQAEDEKERFIHEAKAASSLDHPNICTIYEIGETEDGQMFIAMACYEGETLKDKIERGPLPIDEALDVAIQITEGLATAHSKEITHRDIKPANILITQDGQVKIVDFGLAKLAGRTQLTKEGTTLGTVAYMSPEQAQGVEVDKRTDIWALGVVLYEMLTGQQPFRSEYEPAVMYSILHEDQEPITGLRTGVPIELERIVNKCLEKQPSDRYQHADEVIVDLRHLSKSVSKEFSAAVTKKTPATTSIKTLSPRFWITAFSAAIILFILVWFASQFILEDRPPPAAARGKSIAVMYFENRSGEPDLDKILVDMLTTNLARYDELEVVSSQRLFDILKNMDKLEAQSIDRSVATEVANRAGVKIMMLGSIIHLGSKMRITSQLIDVQSGSVIGSPQADGVKVEDVFSMVDDLTEQVSTTMEVVTGISEAERFQIAEVSTQSFEAYKYYQKGLEAYWRYDFETAAQNHQKAVAIDSTFAMARLYLTISRSWRGLNNPTWDLSPFRESLASAEKYSRGASRKERGFIVAMQAAYDRNYQKAESLFVDYVEQYPNARDAFLFLNIMAHVNGNIEQAIRAIERVLELDPTFAMGYSNLAYCYSELREHEKAISAKKKHLALQPDAMGAYGTACDIYIHAGQLDEALRICEQGLQKNPQWYTLNNRIGFIYLYQGDGERARHYVRQARWYPALEARIIGQTYMFEGRYEKAAEYYRKAANLSLRSGWVPYTAVKVYIELGKVLTVQGKYSEALAAFSEARKTGTKTNTAIVTRIMTEYFIGSAMVKKGDYQEAQVRASRIRELVEEQQHDRFYLDYYHLLLAELHFAQGDGESALAELDNYKTSPHLSPRCLTLRAAILALMGNYEEAVKGYKNFYNFVESRVSGIGGNFFDYYYERSRVPYNLARIYDQMGDTTKAVEYYSKTLDQWKNADADLPELLDAKARLVQLTDVSNK